MHRFTTKSGSEYLINTEAKTWQRLTIGADTATAPNGGLRDEHGTFNDCGVPEIGQRFEMICPPRVEGHTFRYITTSPVAEIHEAY